MTISVTVPPKVAVRGAGTASLGSAQLQGTPKPCAGSYACGDNYRLDLISRSGVRIVTVSPE